ncbi:MAG TPA: hypothetical protein VNG12_20220 [Acidimicrobiales bacterium]|nr:hypothetical protein [Acidimicrobiales bacterium]
MAKTGNEHVGRFGIRALVTGLIVVAGAALVVGLASRQQRGSGAAGEAPAAAPVDGQVEGGI